MLDLALDFLDAVDVEAGVLAQQPRCFRRHIVGFGQRFGRGQLHFQPLAILVFFAPDAAHLGPGVAFDHSVREDLGLLFRLGDHQPREERAAGAIQRAARPWLRTISG